MNVDTFSVKMEKHFPEYEVKFFAWLHERLNMYRNSNFSVPGKDYIAYRYGGCHISPMYKYWKENIDTRIELF